MPAYCRGESRTKQSLLNQKDNKSYAKSYSVPAAARAGVHTNIVAIVCVQTNENKKYIVYKQNDTKITPGKQKPEIKNESLRQEQLKEKRVNGAAQTRSSIPCSNGVACKLGTLTRGSPHFRGMRVSRET